MILEIRNLVKEFKNGLRANDDISISIELGEVFGLLGPNGAGKTTLVNQIIALLKPTSGELILDGVDIIKNPAFAREVCSVQPQGSVPIDGFTPTQAIELVGHLRSKNRFAVKKRTRALIEALELGKWANKPGAQLSGGVRRLVSYSMATVAPGKIVILDEPTNDVDPLRRRLLWKEIRSVADAGTAVLLITHNVLEAERVVDKLAVIDKGKVIASGTPASLKETLTSKLLLDIKLEPGVLAPKVPDFVTSTIVGRRLKASVENGSVTRAIEWAHELQRKKIAEEFSIAPASLEDVYVRMVSRTGVSEDNETENDTSTQAQGV